MNILFYTITTNSYTEYHQIAMNSFLERCSEQYKCYVLSPHQIDNPVLHDRIVYINCERSVNHMSNIYSKNHIAKSLKTKISDYVDISSYDWVVYADSDVIFFRDVSEVIIQSDKKYLYGSYDGKCEMIKKFHICSGFLYFNPKMFPNFLTEWNDLIQKRIQSKPSLLDQPCLNTLIKDKYADRYKYIDNRYEVRVKRRGDNCYVVHYYHYGLRVMKKDYKKEFLSILQCDELNIKLDNIFPFYHHADFSFVQIGANDGRTNDPLYKFIHRYKWKGLFVEPLSKPMILLQSLYKGQRGYRFENAVVSDQNGLIDFYVMKRNSRLSSISMDRSKEFHKHSKQKLDTMVEKIQVKSFRLQTLLKKHNIKTFDLLQVDTEGYDDVVIKQIEDLKFLPKLIHFEHIHLSLNQRRDIIQFLHKKSYRIILRTSNRDLLCIRDLDVHKNLLGRVFPEDLF